MLFSWRRNFDRKPFWANFFNWYLGLFILCLQFGFLIQKFRIQNSIFRFTHSVLRIYYTGCSVPNSTFWIPDYKLYILVSKFHIAHSKNRFHILNLYVESEISNTEFEICLFIHLSLVYITWLYKCFYIIFFFTISYYNLI